MTNPKEPFFIPETAQPPAPEPEPVSEPEEELVEGEEQEQEPEQSDKLRWIGSPKASEAKDGISDLFQVDYEDEQADVDDVMEVDVDKDVIDVDPETGTIEDLVSVDREDIIGIAPERKPRYRIAPRRRRLARRQPPLGTTFGQMRG